MSEKVSQNEDSGTNTYDLDPHGKGDSGTPYGTAPHSHGDPYYGLNNPSSSYPTVPTYPCTYADPYSNPTSESGYHGLLMAPALYSAPYSEAPYSAPYSDTPNSATYTQGHGSNAPYGAPYSEASYSAPYGDTPNSAPYTQGSNTPYGAPHSEASYSAPYSDTPNSAPYTQAPYTGWLSTSNQLYLAATETSQAGSLSSYPTPSSISNQHHPYPDIGDPKRLRFYGKEDRKVLELTRKLFAATTCSLGLFFMRKDSPNKASYDMYAGEALAQAKFELRGMYFKYLSLLILPELIPPYPEECMLTAHNGPHIG